jgi:hypothetical protein
MRGISWLVLAILAAAPLSAQEVGPRDVIAPALEGEIAACMQRSQGPDHGAALACLDRPGVTAAARNLSRAIIEGADFASPGFLVAFYEAGEVDIAEMFFPTMANTNYQMVLVNAADGPVMATTLSYSNTPANYPITRAILRRHPQAFESGRVFVSAVRQLPAGYQRFVLVDIVTDGCRACDVVATSVKYVDYLDGYFMGYLDAGWMPWRDMTSAAAAERIRSGDVAMIQDRLNRLGYEAGPVDGVAGELTRAALGAFQRDHCLPVNPVISDALVIALTQDAPPYVIAPCAPGVRPAPLQRLPFPNGTYVSNTQLCSTVSQEGFTAFEDARDDMVVVMEDGRWNWGLARCDIREVVVRGAQVTLDLDCLSEGMTQSVTEVLDDIGPNGFTFFGRSFSQCSAPGSDLAEMPVQDPAAPLSSGPDEGLMSAISAFRARASEHVSFDEFVSDLNTLREAVLTIRDMREALELFEASLTPRLAAQAELARANQAGLLFIGSHVATFLVKDMYARAAEDPASTPPILTIVPERVALATIDAAFSLSSVAATGGASALVGQTISTATNVVDAVIAYHTLGQETDTLTEQVFDQTVQVIRHFQDGDLSGDLALRQFAVTQAIAEELASGWFTWGPMQDASDRLSIIAGLARIKVLEGEPPLPPRSVLGTGELRARIAQMNGGHCFSCTPAFNQRYLVFADRVAQELVVRGWEPISAPELRDVGGDVGGEARMATPLDGEDLRLAIETDLLRIEAQYNAALGVDQDYIAEALRDAGFLSGAVPRNWWQGAFWPANVASAVRAALRYARAENISYDLSDADGLYLFIDSVRNHRLGGTNGPSISLHQALDAAVGILIGDPYGQTSDEVLGHIVGVRMEQDHPCGAEAAWVFDVLVPSAPSMDGQSIRGDLFVDTRTGRMVCSGLPFLD